MEVNLNETQLREVIEEVVRRLCTLNEGVDIDFSNKTVSFSLLHQKNVDTNDYIRPHIILNTVRNETVLSIFERKDNESRTDGNPLVYALKGINGWRFEDPKSDIFALLRRFVSVTTQLQYNFDTLIMIPSHNGLNSLVFGYLRRLISFNRCISDFFEKMTADDVYELYLNYDYYKSLARDEDELRRMNNALEKSFIRMRTENDGIFSYKYITPLAYRDGIMQSLRINFDGSGKDNYAQSINDRNVLVFDDTVASGKTLSDSAEAIREMFDPASITFLTLFSPKTNADNGITNKRIDL